MLGLIIMSEPLGVVGLSAVVLTHAEVDKPADCAREGASAGSIKEVP